MPLTYGVIDRLALASGITTDDVVVVNGTWVPLRVAVTVCTTRSTVRVSVQVVMAEVVPSALFCATSTWAVAKEAAVNAVAMMEKRIARVEIDLGCQSRNARLSEWTLECSV